MKRLFLLFLTGVLCTLPTLASENSKIKDGNMIMGHVIEYDTEENIAFATIYIEETGGGTMSRIVVLTVALLLFCVPAVGAQSDTDALYYQQLQASGAEDLPHLGGELLVTPRDIDRQVADLSKLLGYGISLALQPQMTVAELELLLG